MSDKKEQSELAQNFCIGSLVQPISIKDQLFSGCCIFHFAVVVSLDPFVLVSEKADMRWKSTVEPEQFYEFGLAGDVLLKKCMRRLDY